MKASGAAVIGVLSALSWKTALAGEEHSNDSWSFDVAGELRERFESVRNPVFGLPSPQRDDYVLHRTIVSGALEHDDSRAFVELISGLTSGFAGSPPATQDDSVDVLQAYVEKTLSAPRGHFVVRAGRQELKLGASRLVSLRESPNVRRGFDGVKATWVASETEVLTAFAVRPVDPQTDAFNDRSSSELRFWGVYSTWPAHSVAGLGVDVYYLGLDREDGHFAEGTARERRHTVGTRLFGQRAGWDWNVESAWQWGSFGEAAIRAWTVSMDAGYEFIELPMSPRLGLKADAISGDRHPNDRKLGTFNPLFPRLPYFSEANLATPANLLDLQPSLRVSVTERLSVNVSWNGLWKYTQSDAYYAPPLRPIADTASSTSRDIGWQASAQIELHATQHLLLAATYVSFEPGAVVRETNGHAGDFFGAWLDWTF